MQVTLRTPWPEWLLRCTDDDLIAVCGGGSVARGALYAKKQAVRTLVCDDDALEAVVSGSGGRAYETLVTGDVYDGEVEVGGECSCPIGIDCKHVVAVVLTARRLARAAGQAASPALSVVREWEARLAPLLGPPDAEPESAPVGLQLELVSATPSRHDATAGTPRLRLRAVVPGKNGRWVRTGATWRDVDNRWSGLAVGPDQREVLRAFLTTQRSRQSSTFYGYGYGDTSVHLDELGPTAWALIDRAVQTGIALLTTAADRKVELAAPATVVVDAGRRGGDLALMPVARLVDGPDVALDDLVLVGAPAHGAFRVDAEALLLLPFTAPLAPAADALARGGTVTVPESDVPDFLQRFYPALRRRAALVSLDGSVELPEVRPPHLVLQVAFEPGHRTVLGWCVGYPSGDQVTLVRGADQTVTRDLVAERALVAGLPDLPGVDRDPFGHARLVAETVLEGMATARFVRDTLPLIRALDGVVVEVTGEPASYGESSEPPRITVSTKDSDQTDWFDLQVSVSVADEDVPVADLLAAIAHGQEELLLPSGTWFGLDRPELVALRRVVEEARALTDRESTGLRLTPFHAGLWEELVGLGVVEHQSARWSATVGGLLALETLPTPPPPAGLQATLRPYQLEGYHWLSLLWDHQLGGILADDMGLGKGLAHGTRVLVPGGWTKVEDLQPGHQVIGRDGAAHTVTGVYDRGLLPTFRVRFNDGASVVVDGEHLWAVQHVQNGHRHPDDWTVVETQALATDLVDGAGNRKWRIPVVAPVQHPHAELPLDPYLLGVLLGDGCLRQSTPMVSTADVELLDLLQPLLPAPVRPVHASAYDYRLSGCGPDHRNPLTSALRDLGLWGLGSHHKFVPDTYLHAAADQRLALLQGLMDTDGSAGPNSTNEFGSVSQDLADAVAHLTESLGGIVRRGSRVLPDGSHAYRVNVKLTICPFRLPRKAARWVAPTKYPPGRIISAIEPAGPAPVTCIAVDAPDKLFVTEHHIVTHNTVQALAMTLRAQEQGTVGGTAGPLLVVAPTSVVATWAREAARFAPSLTVVAVTETAARSGLELADLVGDADVVITSYALFRIDEDAYQGLTWSGLVLDEAQFVKNHQAKTYQCARRLRAPFKLAITGTPLENSLMDLWSMLSITAPGLFPNPQRFTELYRRPIESGSSPEVLAALRRRIRPLMLRRTKDQVAVDLPPRVEQVLPVELNPAHRKVYDKHLARERQRVLGLLDDLQRNRIAILRSLTVLRQLALDASLVDDAHAGKVRSSKIDVLLEQLQEVVAEGHRVLVFSQFTGFLGLVKARLDAEGIGYCYLDGRTRNRPARIAEFTEGTAPVFLISLKAGGVGLTLTEADYVFVLDPWWNPAAEAQAVDRAHRIGQSKTVMVYRLVATDTIEEKVVALQQRKRDLFAQVVDDDAMTGSAMTADDIRGLFT